MPSVYRDLYYRWEREAWEAGALDLEADRERWGSLDAEERDRLVQGSALIHFVAQQLGSTLVPLVDGVPDEEHQVFLTTHLVDEARHYVFTQRFLEEVADVQLRDLVGLVETLDPEVRRLVYDLLPDATRAIVPVDQDGDEDAEAFRRVLEAVRLHHVALQEVLAGVIERVAPVAAPLPGTTAGLRAIERDLRRHREFGRAFLAEHDGARDPEG